jgi:hypothetical protein
MIDIIKRLEATVRLDAINGDSFERSVVNSQIREAIAEIKLYKGLLEAEQEDCQKQRETSQTQWERAEVAARDCASAERKTAEVCISMMKLETSLVAAIYKINIRGIYSTRSVNPLTLK